VVVISGRARSDLESRLGPVPADVALIGSHGAEPAEGSVTAHGDVERYAAALDDLVRETPGVRLERKPFSLALHYRNVAESHQEEVRVSAIDRVGAMAAAVKEGKKVVEFLAVQADKGTALTQYRDTLNERDEAGGLVTIFVGDDVTDEAAFERMAAPDVTVKVGPGETAADYAVEAQEDVAGLLQRLFRLRAEAATHPAYLPMADYSLIGDMRTAALVSRRGSIDWACLPRFDSPSAFARILDHRLGGHFSVQPVGSYESAQRYEEGTNVLVTEFQRDGGRLELVDFMPLDPRRAAKAAPEIHRRLAATGADIEIEIAFRPAFDYARRPARIRRRTNGLLASDGEQHSLTLSTEAPIEWTIDAERGEAVGRFVLRRGQRTWLVVRFDDDEVWPVDEYGSRERLLATRTAWLDWSSGLRYEGAYRAMVERSALLLKLLIYEPTGAIVAAPTTSLPEELGGERNWDYRFSWLRDSTFTLFSLHALGKFGELDRYMGYLKRVCRKESDFLQIMYGVGGELRLDEEVLDHLEGYRGSAPVRIGNGAVEQIQTDVYGEVLDSIHIWRRKHDMTEGMWELVVRLAEWVAANWRRPDSGPWEVRNEPRHFVFSKLMCWVALDRAVRAAEELGLEGDAGADVERWRAEREAVRADILENGWSDEVGAFVQSYGSLDLDAANLVIPIVRFLPPDDPRVVATVERIREPVERGGLTHAETGLVYRYRSADGVSDEADGEGAFCVNTFQLAQVLALQGKIDEAVELFESVLRHASPTGLLAEEIDPVTGEQLGNYPQAYSHIGLINAAHVISRLRRDVGPGDAMLPDNGG
jgi:trehalose-phosphatase